MGKAEANMDKKGNERCYRNAYLILIYINSLLGVVVVEPWGKSGGNQRSQWGET